MKSKAKKKREERLAEIAFGKLIKELRLEYNYTQEYLADQTGFATQTISAIENHGQNVGIGTIKLFAMAFDMTIPELFSRFEDKK